MKQSLRNTKVSDLQRKLSELTEQIVSGFRIYDREYPGLTIKGRRSMLVMLEQVVFFTIGRTSPDRGNVYNVLRRLAKKVLNGSLWQSQYSPKYCAELASQQFDDVGFSESHMAKIREYCAALGVFTIEHREFDRGEDGKFMPGQNKGKKHASWLLDIDLERLALVACAVIQSLKGEFADSSSELDAWARYKPKKGCALLALLWQRMGQRGSIFSPDLEFGDLGADINTADQYREAVKTAADLSASIYESVHLARQNRADGRSPSPAWWEMFRRDRQALREAKAKARSLWRRLSADDPDKQNKPATFTLGSLLESEWEAQVDVNLPY